jgi:hypothetical protein
MKKQAIKIWLSEGQVESIQQRGDLYRYGHRRSSVTLEESITKQIVKQASKLFPEVNERGRQEILAWNIQNSGYGDGEISEGVSAIRAEYASRLNGHQVVVNEAHRKMGEIEQEMREKIEAIFNQKFDEAGITLFRSGYPHGLRRVENKA